MPGILSLMDLPAEILLEILSYHTDLFIVSCPLVQHETHADRVHRRQSLRSLSQTCSILRSISLPLLWEQFEAAKYHFNETYPSTKIARLIFPCIKSVHLSMQDWFPSEIESISLFVEFLQALPNLVGLHIYQVDMLSSALSTAFSNISLPNVNWLRVPSHLHPKFPAFPNVTTLACPKIWPLDEVVSPVKTHFPRLEALVGLHLNGDSNAAAQLSHDFPRLRTISVGSPLQRGFEQAIFAAFRAFPYLSKLIFHHRGSPDFISLDTLIAGGKLILRASPSRDTKVLRIWSEDLFRRPRLIHVEQVSAGYF
ncbi:hypothetical protein B0H19DRAFT_1255143 [Mycena capillaripes]|nr:hypothetical protein B0H19DRAFT_1255143 [Mycena capillaripes]